MDLFELITRVNFDSIWLILIRFEQIFILSWLKLISNCNCRKFEFWHLFVCIFYLFGCCLFVYLFVFLLKLIKLKSYEVGAFCYLIWFNSIFIGSWSVGIQCPATGAELQSNALLHFPQVSLSNELSFVILIIV